MIERSQNYRRVKKLAPDWSLTASNEVYYLVIVESSDDVGVFAFHPCDEEGFLMHVELGEKCRGALAKRAYKNAFEWMFANANCDVLHGRIPAETKHARVMARLAGGKFNKIDIDGLRCYSVARNDFTMQGAS